MISAALRFSLCLALLVTVGACSKPVLRSPETGPAVAPPRSASPVGKTEAKTGPAQKPDKIISSKDRPYAVDGRWYFPLNSVQNYKEEGMASWYGPDFHGKRTSSGETYDMFGPTAAHRILPLNTRVRVRNPVNKKEIVVRINDRGPFVKERIIDLSFDSAKALGLVGPGTAWVELEALGILLEEEGPDGQKTTRLIQQVDYQRGPFLVQFGAFKEYQNAVRLKEKLEPDYKNIEIAEVLIKGDPFYRVRIKCSDQLNEALRLQKELEEKGYNQVLVLSQ
jgi:rare lipoprotein A